MSVEAITWALKQPIASSSAKFVLVVLANCAAGDSMECHPSSAYIAEATGQDRKTVLANIAKLRDWGLIEDTGRRVGMTAQVIVYRLRGDDLIATVPKTERFQKRNSPKNGTVPKTAGNSTGFPPKQSQKRDTEPSEPSGTILNDARAQATAAGALAAGIIRECGLTCGITSQHPRILEAAAVGVTVEHVLALRREHASKPIAYALRAAINQTQEGRELARAGPDAGDRGPSLPSAGVHHAANRRNPPESRVARARRLAYEAEQRERASFAAQHNGDADAVGAHDGNLRRALG